MKRRLVQRFKIYDDNKKLNRIYDIETKRDEVVMEMEIPDEEWEALMVYNKMSLAMDLDIGSEHIEYDKEGSDELSRL